MDPGVPVYIEIVLVDLDLFFRVIDPFSCRNSENKYCHNFVISGPILTKLHRNELLYDVTDLLSQTGQGPLFTIMIPVKFHGHQSMKLWNYVWQRNLTVDLLTATNGKRFAYGTYSYIVERKLWTGVVHLVSILWNLGKPSKIRPTVSSRQNIPAV